jgi:hypothetical protein
MAFSFTIVAQGAMGDKAYVIGTWDGNGVTSGDIVTGLSAIESVAITDTTAVRAGMTTDYTSTAGTIALGSFTSSDVGCFIAWGRA